MRECTQRQGLAVTGETLGQTCYGDDMTRCVCRRSFSDCDALGTHGAEQVGTFFFFVYDLAQPLASSFQSPAHDVDRARKLPDCMTLLSANAEMYMCIGDSGLCGMQMRSAAELQRIDSRVG